MKAWKSISTYTFYIYIYTHSAYIYKDSFSLFISTVHTIVHQSRCCSIILIVNVAHTNVIIPFGISGGTGCAFPREKQKVLDEQKNFQLFSGNWAFISQKVNLKWQGYSSIICYSVYKGFNFTMLFVLFLMVDKHKWDSFCSCNASEIYMCTVTTPAPGCLGPGLSRVKVLHLGQQTVTRSSFPVHIDQQGTRRNGDHSYPRLCKLRKGDPNTHCCNLEWNYQNIRK